MEVKFEVSALVGICAKLSLLTKYVYRKVVETYLPKLNFLHIHISFSVEFIDKAA